MSRGLRRGAFLLLTPLMAMAACGSGGGGGENGNGAKTAERGEAADEQSCYARAGLDVAPPQPARALFVVVDQTTGLDERLRETVTNNVRRLLGPGTSYSIATFSAYGRGNYAQVAASGELEAPLPEDTRASLPVRRVERLDACLERQREARSAEVLRELDEAMSASATAFTHSEIMASLDQLSQAVDGAAADEKLVILVSDLLEHSGDRSFYRNRELRAIDPQAELRSAEESGLTGAFGGARVAVVGAGFLSPESRSDTIRDRAALTALRTFWEQWFRSSGAQVVQYGEPDLVTPLSWGGSTTG